MIDDVVSQTPAVTNTRAPDPPSHQNTRMSTYIHTYISTHAQAGGQAGTHMYIKTQAGTHPAGLGDGEGGEGLGVRGVDADHVVEVCLGRAQLSFVFVFVLVHVSAIKMARFYYAHTYTYVVIIV